jgi:hypothetical protein
MIIAFDRSSPNKNCRCPWHNASWYRHGQWNRRNKNFSDRLGILADSQDRSVDRNTNSMPENLTRCGDLLVLLLLGDDVNYCSLPY